MRGAGDDNCVLSRRVCSLIDGRKAMVKRGLLFAAFAMIAALQAFAGEEPPTSQEAKRIEALVNKAAALVDQKG